MSLGITKFGYHESLPKRLPREADLGWQIGRMRRPQQTPPRQGRIAGRDVPLSTLATIEPILVSHSDGIRTRIGRRELEEEVDATGDPGCGTVHAHEIFIENRTRPRKRHRLVAAWKHLESQGNRGVVEGSEMEDPNSQTHVGPSARSAPVVSALHHWETQGRWPALGPELGLRPALGPELGRGRRRLCPTVRVRVARICRLAQYGASARPSDSCKRPSNCAPLIGERAQIEVVQREREREERTRSNAVGQSWRWR